MTDGGTMETQTGLYFKKISEKLERRANEEAAPREITFSQGRLLCYLHGREGEKVTMRDIERFFGCAHATVSGLVSRLQEKGYVSVETDESDRRAKIVRTTPKEERCFREMQERHKKIEEILLSGFSEEEKAALISFLERVCRNLG